MDMVQAQVPLVAGFVLATVCASPMAQSPPLSAAKPSFEVTSVKPNKSGDRGASMAEQPGGRFIATNMTLATLVRSAFGLQEWQLVGLPDWASSERFDIVAKAEQEFPRTNERPRLAQLMMQSLFEDRFRLRSHRETRELPAYALVVARADGRLGPQLKPSDIDCAALAAAGRASGSAPRGGGGAASTSSTPPVPSPRRPCSTSMAGGTLRAGSTPLAYLAVTLSSATQRMVVDHTGLTGGFDFDLTFSTEQSADPTSPSVFTAVQEQLGLKLEPLRLPTEVLVIDSVDRPSPD